MRDGIAKEADVIGYAVAGHGQHRALATGEAGQPGGEDRLAAPRSPWVVLLRGAPGVGKSTASALLGAREAVGAVVEVDRIRRLLVDLDWGNRRQHEAAIAAAAGAAVEFAVAGFSPVLLVDCFGRDHAQRAARFVRRGGADVEVISLWASPTAIRARLALRSDDYDNVGMALLLNDEMRVGSAHIDTTELTVDQVADQILACIERLP